MIVLILFALITGLLLGAFLSRNLHVYQRKTFERFLDRNKKNLTDDFLEEIESVHGLPVWEVKALLKKHGYEERIEACKYVRPDGEEWWYCENCKGYGAKVADEPNPPVCYPFHKVIKVFVQTHAVWRKSK